MFLDQPRPEDPVLTFRTLDLGAIGLLSAATLLLGIRFNWLLERVQQAGRVFTG
jgi:hypothetical protein